MRKQNFLLRFPSYSAKKATNKKYPFFSLYSTLYLRRMSRLRRSNSAAERRSDEVAAVDLTCESAAFVLVVAAAGAREWSPVVCDVEDGGEDGGCHDCSGERLWG